MAFPAYLAGTPQVLVKMPTVGLIPPDVTIDGFMADKERPVFAQPARDLFWAPQFLEMFCHDPKVTSCELAIPA